MTMSSRPVRRAAFALLLGATLAGCMNSPLSGGGGDGATGRDLAGGGAPDLASGGTGDLAGGARDLAGGGGPDLARPPQSDLAMPSGTDPNADGPWQVARFDVGVPVSGGTLQTTVYGPSDDGQSVSLRGPFPLVVVSPGFQIDRNNYAGYARRLASHGILAVTQSYRNAGDHTADANDTAALISWLLQPTGANAAKVMGRVDPARIGLTGHSLGGKVSFYAAQKDPRVVAVIGIDPVDGTKPPFGQVQPSAIAGMPALKARTGVLGETTDATAGIFGTACAPAAENYEKFYQSAASPSFAITFAGAGHMQFLDDPRCLVCGVCNSAKADAAKVRALAIKYVTAFFRLHLLGDAGAASYLGGAAFAADAASGAVTIATK